MSMRLSLARTFVIARTTAAIGIVALLGSAIIAAQNAPVRAGTPGVSHPGIVEAGPPVYPPIAQSARVQGDVIIEAFIDATGRVDGAAVTTSIPLLDAAAIDVRSGMAIRTAACERTEHSFPHHRHAALPAL